MYTARTHIFTPSFSIVIKLASTLVQSQGAEGHRLKAVGISLYVSHFEPARILDPVIGMSYRLLCILRAAGDRKGHRGCI